MTKKLINTLFFRWLLCIRIQINTVILKVVVNIFIPSLHQNISSYLYCSCPCKILVICQCDWNFTFYITFWQTILASRDVYNLKRYKENREIVYLLETSLFRFKMILSFLSPFLTCSVTWIQMWDSIRLNLHFVASSW